MEKDNSHQMTDSKATWHTISEAAHKLGVSTRTVQRRIEKEEIESKLEGRTRYVKLSSDDIMTDSNDVMTDMVSQGALIEQLQGEVEYLRKKLEAGDEELQRERERSEQAKERSDTIVLQLTRQLEQSQRLLEHHQEPWYRRWFRKKQNEEMN